VLQLFSPIFDLFLKPLKKCKESIWLVRRRSIIKKAEDKLSDELDVKNLLGTIRGLKSILGYLITPETKHFMKVSKHAVIYDSSDINDSSSSASSSSDSDHSKVLN
jgi:hypothetical protein